MQCLESMSHDMAKPSELLYVDVQRFGDGAGNILTMSSKTSPMYLSNKYPVWTIEAIKWLGVQKLSAKDFIKHLRILLSDEESEFQKKSPSWHGDLAKILLSLMKDHSIRNNLEILPIIPLAEGKWVSAHHNPKPVFISGDLNLDDFPIHNALPIVDAKAVAQKDRKALYQALGIAAIAETQICDFICELHASPTFQPEDWTTAQLISHAKALFRWKWTPPDQPVDLWFATDDDKRCRGSRLYFQGRSERSGALEIFSHLRKQQSVIHPDYFQLDAPMESFYTSMLRHNSLRRFDSTGWIHNSRSARRPESFGDNHRWKSFLVKSLKLSTIPRLAIPIHGGYIISEEFRSFLRDCAVADWLQLLETEWYTYSQWLGPKGSAGEDYSTDAKTTDMLPKVMNLEVRTSCGRRRLSTTFVPDLDSLIPDIAIPVLDIKGPIKETTKQKLHLLGVTIENNIGYYLSCLRAMEDQATPDMETLIYVYEQIQTRYNDAQDEIEYVIIANPSKLHAS